MEGCCRERPFRERLQRTRTVVPSKGLEPPHPCEYMDLNHARLPIPPRWHKKTGMRHSFLEAACQERTTSNILQGERRLFKLRTAMENSTKPRRCRGQPSRSGPRSQQFAGDGPAGRLSFAGGRSSTAGTKKWAQMIDAAARDAARINREIRKILNAQSQALVVGHWHCRLDSQA